MPPMNSGRKAQEWSLVAHLIFSEVHRESTKSSEDSCTCVVRVRVRCTAKEHTGSEHKNLGSPIKRRIELCIWCRQKKKKKTTQNTNKQQHASTWAHSSTSEKGLHSAWLHTEATSCPPSSKVTRDGQNLVETQESNREGLGPWVCASNRDYRELSSFSLAREWSTSWLAAHSKSSSLQRLEGKLQG